MSDFPPNRCDFRGGVKSKTHRRQWPFPVFPVFPGCSLEGYAPTCARVRSRADATYLQRIGGKSGKSRKSLRPLAVKISHLPFVGVKSGVKSGGGYGE